MFVLGQTRFNQLAAQPAKPGLLIVPPLALTLTTRKPMYARMSTLQTSMLISVREL